MQVTSGAPSFAAALFDLDGTLQDSEIHWIEATRDFLADNGISFTMDDATELVYGRSSTDIYNDIRAMEPFRGRTVEELAGCIREYYGRIMQTTEIAYPSSVALLKRLAREIPVAIVSGSPRLDVEQAAHELGVADDLSLVMGAEDVSHGKPNPECFLKAAAELGVPAERCIVFEDSAAGVQAAKRAKMFCVAISRPNRPKQDVSPADIIVQDLEEFEYQPGNANG